MSVDALKDVLKASVNMAEPMKQFAEVTGDAFGNFEEVKEESEKKARKQTSVTVLIEGGITVSKDSNEYTVVGGEIKNKLSHFNTFEGAMQEVSDRLFLGKLTKRAEEGRADFESLVRLVEEHKAEMKEKFKL